MSWNQIQCGCYDKMDCDNKFALKSSLNEYATKTDIPSVVQSDKVVGEGTKLVPSLSYAVNTYTIQAATNIL